MYTIDKLDWSRNSEVIYKKGQSCIFTEENGALQHLWDNAEDVLWSVVASVSLLTVVFWGNQLKVADSSKNLHRASNVAGIAIDSMTVVVEKRTFLKLKTVLNNTSHLLRDVLDRSKNVSSQKLLQQRCSTLRHRKSFTPGGFIHFTASLNVSIKQNQ